MIYEHINELIAKAMLSKDKKRLETLRLIKAEMLKAEKDGTEMTEANQIKILLKMITQHEESIAQFNGRQDLIDGEMEELSIIKEFVPQQPSNEEITALAEDIIASFEQKNGSVTMRDTKAVLNAVQSKYPTANGKLISSLIIKHL